MSYQDFLHICRAGNIADGIQNHFAVPANQILSFADDLTFGPIDDIDTGAINRASFLKHVYDEPVLCQMEMQGGLEEILQREASQLQFDTPRTPKPIVIWHGNNAADQLLLRRVVCQLRHQIRPLFELNLPLRDRNGIVYDTETAVPAPYCVEQLWTRFNPIDMTRQQILIADWQRLRKDKGLRQISGQRLTVHSLGALDASILQLFVSGWKSINDIGMTSVTEIEGNPVSSVFVNWRIRELVSGRKMETRSDNGVEWARVTTREGVSG
ncbi:DUF1835 domain-containing protein [Brucella pituitosa]|uniref:DUF1835 domain-containing protein n=1 Tax=Brucella pituitosa TaxID=571256 RepID=UPI0009A160AD|nr:DUF1835 domain-containing protein [Brucella pituitosa]